MIETERLLIRRFKTEDWEDIYAYLSDPEVVKYEPYSPATKEDSKKETVRRVEDSAFYAVSLKSGKVIGNLYLNKGEFDTWELGYVFNRHYWGKGYAAESTVSLLKYAFTSLSARRIIAMCNPENEKSWKLLERLGMRREGHLKQNIYFSMDKNGFPVWQDTYEYGLLKDEIVN